MLGPPETVTMGPEPLVNEAFVEVTEQEIAPKSNATSAVSGGVVKTSTVTVAAIVFLLRGVTKGTAMLPPTPPLFTLVPEQDTSPGTST